MSKGLHVPFLDLARTYEAERTEIDSTIQRVLNRGRFILGDEVAAFEAAFAAHCGARHAVGVASGTDAIALALLACGVGAGDEVITVANTCVPTVAGIEATGARAAFCDVDPDTLTMDPRRLPEALTERTRAILPVHLYGQCAPMAAIRAFAERHRLAVVEDAAHAHGASQRGQRAGTLGDAAAFSFYPTKNLGAFGDGGMVVTSAPEVAERLRLLRNYGERQRYEHEVKGKNSRLDELQAAILRTRMARLDRNNERRREIARQYCAAFADTGVAVPQTAEGNEHVYHLFVVRVPDRKAFRAALAERGVETLIHYPTVIPRQKAYAEYLPSLRHLPVSERATAEVVSLPLFPGMRDAEVEAVIAATREAAASRPPAKRS